MPEAALRSALFVPATRPERFPKAIASGADAVIVDLEDAVAPDQKAAGRESLARYARAHPHHHLWVRINDGTTKWFEDDLALCRSLPSIAGIVAGLPHAVGGTLELARTGAFSVPFVLFIFAVVVIVTAVVCFVERGQRKILVNYAKRQVGRKVYGGQSSHLPLKLNMSGVIPPIFASSIILFPATLGSWFGTSEHMGWLKTIAGTLHPGSPIYTLLYAGAIVFFCFFYTALVFNPKETADNLKKSGAFVPGIRPGEQTARYIEKIMMRLTLAGAVYVTLVCLLPEFLVVWKNVPFYFGGTSLLIIVVVTMDFMAQVQAYIMSHQYESLLKKANFKGGMFPTR
jgi:preprotein translocase subunit SecY